MSNVNPNNPPPQGFGAAFWNWVLANILFIKRRLNALAQNGGGGGGSQNLEQVTLIGNTTPYDIVVTDGTTHSSTITTGDVSLVDGTNHIFTNNGQLRISTADGDAYIDAYGTEFDSPTGNTYIGLTTNSDDTPPVIYAFSTNDVFIHMPAATAERNLNIPDADGTFATVENLADYVPYTGATTDINVNNKQIKMVATPTAMQDAANKAYVDTVAASLSWKTVVRVATAAALPAGIYNNGASGVGATFTVTATGTLTIDGVVTTLNDRVLIRNQVSAFQNGIYSVTTAGAVGVQAVLTRTTDADAPTELVSAAVSTGSEGSTNANKAYIQVTPATITVGTTDLVFNVFLNTILSPGAGIRISGNIIYNRLAEGLLGGQTVIGGTAGGDTLSFQATTASAVVTSVDSTGSWTLPEGGNLIAGTTTGTKIGTSSSQKWGFFGATPIVQPSGDIITALGNLGLVTSPTITVPAGSGGLIGFRVFTTPGAGTYTPTSGTSSVVIVVIGAGGGGGGTQGSNGQSAMAGGGGAGAWLIKRLTGISGTYSYTIGTGGTAGVGNALIGSVTDGGAGGSTTITIGVAYTAPGGSGGIRSASNASTLAAVLGGAGGTLPSTGDTKTAGQMGGSSVRLVPGTGVGSSGIGAGTPWGSGGSNGANAGTTGGNGSGIGSGGGGGIAVGSTPQNGGAGASGGIIIYEYK